MRVSPFGYPEVVKYGAASVALSFFLYFISSWLVLIPLALWLCALCFFRDPERAPEGGAADLVAPADGRVTEVLDTEHPYTGKARRIGIFLSVFDVHVNRSPCAGRVEHLLYKPGAFRDARSSEASTANESNEIGIASASGGRILVRQISGAIARRIVCAVKGGQTVARGERIGMIKFGSRAELFFDPEKYEACVKAGDVVRGGRTLLARSRSRSESPRSVAPAGASAQEGSP